MKPVVLIIRDGWGVSPNGRAAIEKEGNATLLAKTPVQDRLLQTCPSTLLIPSGEAVGLPEGQMGNSEVGHLNLGAGRIVYQELTRITRSIRDKSFFQTAPLKHAMEKVARSGSRLHLMGLLSDGGVHSHIDHLFALLEMAKQHNVSRVLIHCFTDGRDTSPTSGIESIQALQNFIAANGIGRVATIIGRYFAMDRDNRWERTTAAYRAIVNGEGTLAHDPVQAMRDWYAQGKTDEFIPPTIIAATPAEVAAQRLENGDGVIFFNFRSDRTRQLTRAIMAKEFDGFERGPRLQVDFVCLTEYDKTFNLPVAFPPQSLKHTLGEILAANGRRQLRVAETEKYPHVTFFFNGGIETPAKGEERLLVPSPKVATYDLQPEMSAYEVTRQLIERLETGAYDVVILNFANPDMVGHTGSIPAATKAVDVTDECVGRVLEVVEQLGGVALVTADHGNAERMLDDEGKPHTAHTTNLVHLFLVGKTSQPYKLRAGILADVAPTMLELIGLPQPAEMTGKSLLEA